jgi:hypothetical protein
MRKNVTAQLKRHAGPVFVAVKHTIEGGTTQFAIHLQPGGDDAVLLRPSDPPACDFNFHEIDPLPASIYYDPKA